MTDVLNPDNLNPDRLRPTLDRERHLPEMRFLTYPIQIDQTGPQVSTRAEHIREQIEQLLMTAPGERIHRPEFGVGADHLVFEGGGEQLRALVRQRLTATLAEALTGQVDPESLRTEILAGGDDHMLIIRIGYRIATIGREFEHDFTVRR